MSTSTKTHRKPTSLSQERNGQKTLPAADSPAELRYVSPDAIEAHPDNPRDNWPTQELDALADSLRQCGVVQPVIVRPDPAGRDGRYQLIAGERRLRAARLAKLKAIPVIVRDDLDDADALTLMLAENLNRVGLAPLERAKLLSRLCESIAAGGAGKSEAQVAEMFGKSVSWVKNTRRLLKLPETWRTLLAGGVIPETAARSVVGYCGNDAVLDAAAKDLAANPWAWRTRDDCERSLRGIADGLISAPKSPAKEPRAVRAAPARSTATTSSTPRAAGPFPGKDRASRDDDDVSIDDEAGEPRGPALADAAIHRQIDSGDDCGAVVALIARLDCDELGVAQSAINARRRALAARKK